LQPEPTRLPDIDTLQLNAAGGGAVGTAAEGGGGRGLGSYPIVPAPSAEESWLAGLAVPPGASVNIPSAPPAPDGQQQQQQQTVALPDYYDYIVPSTTWAPPAAAGPGRLLPVLLNWWWHIIIGGGTYRVSSEVLKADAVTTQRNLSGEI
jgi:hypothetical protein